jgi:hypothetical protein
MMMAWQWRQRWSGGGGGDGAEAVEQQRQQRWRSAPAAKLPPPTPQPSCRHHHHRPRSVALLPRKSCHRRAACAKLQQPPAATASRNRRCQATGGGNDGGGGNQLIVVCVYAHRHCVAAVASPPSRCRRCIASVAVLIAAASWTPWLKSTPVLAAGARMGGSKINGGGCGCGCGCSTRRIAGTTMWDDVSRPTIEGCLGSDGLLSHVPFFELLLSALDGVTGRATLAGMRLNAPRLRQLAPEAKLCTSLCPPIGGVNSAHAMMSMVRESSSKRSRSVVWCFFSAKSKRRPPNTPPRRNWDIFYLLARPYA